MAQKLVAEERTGCSWWEEEDRRHHMHLCLITPTALVTGESGSARRNGTKYQISGIRHFRTRFFIFATQLPSKDVNPLTKIAIWLFPIVIFVAVRDRFSS